MKKSVAVFCSDPLPSTQSGVWTYEAKRAFQTAHCLSTNFNVSLFLPQDIEFSETLPFKIERYNSNVSNWSWSEELDRKLKNKDFAIIQPMSGIGIQNFTVLPTSVNVIVDGWSLLLLEYSGYLLTQPKIARKLFWKKCFDQYKELLKRANCILLGNDNQRYFYEGLFFGIDKLDYSSFQFSVTLKVPFGIEGIFNLQKDVEDSAIHLLWEGPIYPWDRPEEVIRQLKEQPNISLDFANVKHPSYNKTYNTYFKTILEEADTCSNIRVLPDTKEINYSKYSAGICLTRDWIIGNYLHKPNVLKMISHNLPVFTNMGDPLIKDLPSSIIPIESSNLLEFITNYITCRANIIDHEDILKQYGWDVVFKPLVKYIETF